MNKIAQTLIQAWAMSSQKYAAERKISQHMAKVILWGLKGPDSLLPQANDAYGRLSKRMSDLGMDIYFVSGFRTAKEQDELYSKGRYTPGTKVTNAKGLQSYHNYCIAFDVAFKRYNWRPPHFWWDVLGREGKKLGLLWGGDFGDNGHFRYDVGKTWKEMTPYFQKGRP